MSQNLAETTVSKIASCICCKTVAEVIARYATQNPLQNIPNKHITEQAWNSV